MQIIFEEARHFEMAKQSMLSLAYDLDIKLFETKDKLREEMIPGYTEIGPCGEGGFGSIYQVK